MKSSGKIALLAIGVLAAQPALASDKQDFVTCDGRKHPGKSDDGMRGEATRDAFDSYANRGMSPDLALAACTRALESARLLPGQTLRRAHLLRARAVVYLQTRQPDKALADLDLADAATATLQDEPFFQRSMGASMLLLRGVAKAQLGDKEAAFELARRAAEVRPYAYSVQYVAASIMQFTRPLGGASTSPWEALVRLQPDAAIVSLNREAEVGNFAGVVAMRQSIDFDWPEGPLTHAELIGKDSAGPGYVLQAVTVLNSAYAYAATGDPANARRELAEFQAQRDKVAALGADPAAFGLPGLLDRLNQALDAQEKLVEARIAVAEGRHAEAIAALVGTRLPDSAATLELIEALKASVPADSAMIVPDAEAWRTRLVADRGDGLPALARSALISLETPRAVIDYERARPNILGELVGAAFSMGTTLLDGVDRTDGFRSTTNPDGTVIVEFIGNTPSAPMVQEMTLLRAAELTKAAGKDAFVIVERSDYTRTLQMTRGGIPVSSTPQGFKTELTIRLVDAGAEPARAFDALTVIDALGPLYYQAAAPRVAAR